MVKKYWVRSCTFNGSFDYWFCVRFQGGRWDKFRFFVRIFVNVGEIGLLSGAGGLSVR